MLGRIWMARQLRKCKQRGCEIAVLTRAVYPSHSHCVAAGGLPREDRRSHRCCRSRHARGRSGAEAICSRRRRTGHRARHRDVRGDADLPYAGESPSVERDAEEDKGGAEQDRCALKRNSGKTGDEETRNSHGTVLSLSVPDRWRISFVAARTVTSASMTAKTSNVAPTRIEARGNFMG